MMRAAGGQKTKKKKGKKNKQKKDKIQAEVSSAAHRFSFRPLFGTQFSSLLWLLFFRSSTASPVVYICATTDSHTDICAPIRYCISLRCNKRCNILSDVASLPDLQISYRNLSVFIYVLLLFSDFQTVISSCFFPALSFLCLHTCVFMGTTVN